MNNKIARITAKAEERLKRREDTLKEVEDLNDEHQEAESEPVELSGGLNPLDIESVNESPRDYVRRIRSRGF